MKDDLHMHRALKYAADMRNMEKQGRLMILPCAPGSMIYIVRPKCDSVPFEECSMYECDGECPHVYEYDIETAIFDCEMMYQFCCGTKYVLNENVFLDMESAREKIKELITGGKLPNLTL